MSSIMIRTLLPVVILTTVTLVCGSQGKVLLTTHGHHVCHLLRIKHETLIVNTGETAAVAFNAQVGRPPAQVGPDQGSDAEEGCHHVTSCDVLIIKKSETL